LNDLSALSNACLHAEKSPGKADSVEDMVAQLMGQIKASNWVQSVKPMDVNIFDLAAEAKAEREAIQSIAHTSTSNASQQK
jgi:hypothetical protein